jgi:tetratricopeptide (TPR) repeat protein
MIKSRVNYILVFLFFGIIHCISQAQQNFDLSDQHEVDSLNSVLKTEHDDTNKVNTFNRLSNILCKKNVSYSQADSLARLALALSVKLNFLKGTSISYGNIGLVCDYQSNYPEALVNDLQSLNIAEKIGYKKGVGNAYKNIGDVYSDQGNYSEAFKNFSSALKIVEEIGDKKELGYVYQAMGAINNRKGNYVEATKELLQGLKMAEEIGDKQAKGSVYLNLGNVYFMQGNFPEALKDFSQAEALGNKQVVKKAYGNIGFIYCEQGNYPEAIKNEMECLKISEEIGDKHDICAAYVNIGNVYDEQGNLPEALNFLVKSLKMGEEIGDKHGVGCAYVNIGTNLIGQKKYPEAIKYLDSAIVLSKNLDEKDILRDAYRNLANIAETKGNYKSAYTNYQTYIIYRDSIINQKDIKKITEMQVSYGFEKREDSIRVEQEKRDIVKTAEINRKSIITYSAIIIALLTFILAIVLINRQQIKRKKDKIIFEKSLSLSETEKNLLNLENIQMEGELENAKAMLVEYTHNMVEKNRLLEEFKVDFENLKNLKSKELDEIRVEHLEYLNKTTILTEEDWNKFKELFDHVYKGFFIRLKEKLPGLTNAEMRLICLTKLKVDTKQMAGILGVSDATIRQSRYRLRKKIGLLEEDTIDDIVESV